MSDSVSLVYLTNFRAATQAWSIPCTDTESTAGRARLTRLGGSLAVPSARFALAARHSAFAIPHSPIGRMPVPYGHGQSTAHAAQALRIKQRHTADKLTFSARFLTGAVLILTSAAA
jgi:hypothetical protein